MFGYQKENEANLIQSDFLFLLAKYYYNVSMKSTTKLLLESVFCVISIRYNAC